MKFILLFFAIIFPLSEIIAQVNTETMRRELDGEGIYHQINFDLGLTSGNTEYTLLRTAYRVDLLRDKFHHYGIISYSYAQDANRRRENRGFIHLRSVYDYIPRIAFEAFAQKEFNEFILLKDRNLIGGGARGEIVNFKADSNSKLTLYSFVGVGAMIEHEYIDTKPIHNAIIARMTSYLTIGADLAPNFNMKLVNYYQPHIDNFDNYRFLTEGNLNFKVSKNVSFRTSLRMRYDSNPPPTIKKRDLNILNGIQVNF